MAAPRRLKPEMKRAATRMACRLRPGLAGNETVEEAIGGDPEQAGPVLDDFITPTRPLDETEQLMGVAFIRELLSRRDPRRGS